MHHYLFQIAYTAEAWQILISNPENRAAAVRPTIQKMGGDISASWVCLGAYDLVVILSLPDDITATAAAMAFKAGAGGALRMVDVTRLLSWDEGLKAMAKASAYAPQHGPPATD